MSMYCIIHYFIVLDRQTPCECFWHCNRCDAIAGVSQSIHLVSDLSATTAHATGFAVLMSDDSDTHNVTN